MHFIYPHPQRPEAIVFGAGHLVRWDIREQPRVLADLRWPSAQDFASLAVGPDGVILRRPPAEPGGVKGTIELASWEDPGTAEQIHLEGATAWWQDGAFSGDNRYLGLADDWEQLLLLDRATGHVGITDTGARSTAGLVFSPDSQLLAVVSTDQGGGHIGLWQYDPETLELRCTEMDRQGAVPDSRPGDLVETVGKLAFSPDGRLLAALLTGWGLPIELILYEVAAARVLWQITLAAERFSPDDWGSEVLFTPDGGGLVHGSATGGLVVRNVETGDPIQQIPWQGGQDIFVVACDPLRRGVWTVDADGTPVLLKITGCGFRAGA